MKKILPCPCGSKHQYSACCGRYLDGGENACDAEKLMRSRYTAYTLLREDYLLLTWHPSTRPAALNLVDDLATKWLVLEVKQHVPRPPDQAQVEFVARYKIAGRAYRLHEISQFVREQGLWFYLTGEDGAQAHPTGDVQKQNRAKIATAVYP